MSAYYDECLHIEALNLLSVLFQSEPISPASSRSPMAPAKLEGCDRPKEEGARVCINDALTDDELRAVLGQLETEEERDLFGLVCKRWLRLQSTERRRLRARAGPVMLRRMADRFPGLVELDLSQSASRSFYPGVTDSDLAVIAAGLRNLRVLDLHNCKGEIFSVVYSLKIGCSAFRLKKSNINSLVSVPKALFHQLTETFNSLSGLVSDFVDQFQELQKLDLSFEQFGKDEPQGLLSHDKLAGHIPSQIDELGSVSNRSLRTRQPSHRDNTGVCGRAKEASIFGSFK
ncbi:hypothetical protein B296_00043518 [Ensete ventricosum]|uniref:COI1 F-box domain-containing protein n=1 Tax=Ensete ventricosum TaxID=4639 RepID=A0A426XBY5_ENSVE|nr:hypothetical protein B296_00043518 [Ensete ventricosum]